MGHVDQGSFALQILDQVGEGIRPGLIQESHASHLPDDPLGVAEVTQLALERAGVAEDQ